MHSPQGLTTQGKDHHQQRKISHHVKKGAAADIWKPNSSGVKCGVCQLGER